MKAAERSVAVYLMWSFFLLPLFPESDQSIGRLTLTHMENPTALEVNDNGLVRIPFSDGKLVYADAVHSLKRGRRHSRVWISLIVSHDTPKRWTVSLRGHPFQEVDHIPCKSASVTVTVRGKGYSFLTILVTIRTLTLVAADFHPQNYLFTTDRKADKVASAKTILHQMGMTALGTAFRSSFTVDM